MGSSGRRSHRRLCPRRITATVPEKIYELLVARSDQEGRSVSNLVAFLVERALTPQQSAAPDRIRRS